MQTIVPSGWETFRSRKRIVPLLVALLAAASFSAAVQAAATFKEAGGIVVVEAEHFDARTKATDNDHAYKVAPDELTTDERAAAVGSYRNARGGRYVTPVPDSGENRNSTDLQAIGPAIDYKVQITTTGTYQLYVRGLGYDGAADSFYASIVELKTSNGGPGPDFYRFAPNPDTADFSAVQNLPFDGTTVAGWTGNGTPDVINGGDLSDDAPAVWTISRAGTYTIRFQQREDGNGIDALILQLSSRAIPANPGPAESEISAGFLIGNHPTDQAATIGQTATFTVTALVPAGTAVTYRWQQRAPNAASFTDIAGAASASYTTPSVTDAMNGTLYQVILTSGGTSLTSASARLITDAVAPTIVGAYGSPDLKNVTVRFSERVTQATAETLANYTVAGLTLSNPKLQANGTDVVLTTATQTAGTSYTLAINGVRDVAGNSLNNGQTKFAGATATAGGILQKFWNNITINNVDTLRNDPRFPNSPTFTTIEPRFEYPPNGSNEGGSTYGNQLIGWLVPTVTADYVFFVCSDDPSELYLSTDDTAANKKLIAQETAWSNARQWLSSGGGSDLSSKRSDQFASTEWPGGNTIRLTAGRQYYIETLHTEGGGGDNVGVAWKTASNPDPADGTAPIDGAFLRTIADPTVTINITLQPVNQTVQGGAPVSFAVGFTSFSAFGTSGSIQWQKAPAGSTNYAAIAGATSATLAIPFAATADNGAKYRAAVTSGGTTVFSSAATLTVSADAVPPTLVSVSADTRTVIVAFSEPLDAASATAAANYKISGTVTISGATVVSKAGEAGVVALAAAGLTPGGSYTVTVTGVKDAAGNTIASTTRSFDVFHISSNFNDGAVPAGSGIVGSANVKASGGPDGSGFLELTTNAGSLQGSIVYPDVLNGAAVTKFTATFKMRIGQGSGNPADGFSFNLGPDIGDPAAPSSFGEEGRGSGLTIAFDTYDNGAAEAPAIGVKFGGNEFAKTNITKAAMVNNQWVDVVIRVYADGSIDVYHNNIKYFDKLPIDGWSPIAGAQLGLGARTGGEFEVHWIDDLKVVYNADIAVNEPPTVAITAPANNATFAVGANVTIQVNAQDKEGQIAKVEYFANGSKIGESATAPYSLTVPNVPQGAYLLSARITDVPGISTPSPAIKVVVGTPEVFLFVTTDPGPLTFSGDQAVYEHMLSRGYDVKLARGSDVPDDGSTANGTIMVLQSSSLGSGTVVAAAGGSKFKNLTIPALVWEASNEDDFGFQELNGATTANQTQINIVDAAHPAAAGFPAGLREIVTSPQTFSQGTPTNAHVVATLAADPLQAVMYFYEKGEKGFGGFVMPARRGFIFLNDTTAASLNADGWKIFDAAVDYMLGKGTTTPPPQITVARTGSNLSISWTNGGTLQFATSLKAPITWTDIPGNSPQTIDTRAATVRFFRVRR